MLLGAPRLQLRMGFFRQGAGAAFEGQGQTRSPFLAEEERPKGLGDEAAGVEVEVESILQALETVGVSQTTTTPRRTCCLELDRHAQP